MRAVEGNFTATPRFPKSLARIYDSIKLPETAKCRDANLWLVDPNVDFSQTSLSAAMSKNGIRNDLVMLEPGADRTGVAALPHSAGLPPWPGGYDNAVIVLPDEQDAHETVAADRFQAVAKQRHYYVVSPATGSLTQRVELRAIHSDPPEGANAPSCATSVGKRTLDISFSALAIFFLLPLFLLIALLVKSTSRGPVIFRQERKGLAGKEFSILKFRSMQVVPHHGDVLQAVKNDPRVTPIGKWLRKTSLDELPQLFNVLRGDMSIVGPRPHAVSHDDYYLACVVGYAQRRSVKPGITGWAQVRGARGETPRIEDMKNRIEHDLWYIQNWSFLMDVVIIALTIRCLAGHHQAY